MKSFLIGLTLALAVSFLPWQWAYGQGNYGLSETAAESGYDQEKTLGSSLNIVVSAALGVMAFIFFGMMLYSGLRWMTARGNEDLVTRARDTLEAAVIGLIVVLLSYALVRFIFQRLGTGDGGAANNQPSGFCTSDADCKQGEYCDVRYNSCLPRVQLPKGNGPSGYCTKDTDCKTGEKCDLKLNLCLVADRQIKGGYCESDRDCRAGEYCDLTFNSCFTGMKK